MITREWFSIAELRAAGVRECFLQDVEADFDRFPIEKAGVRLHLQGKVVHAERIYNASIFNPADIALVRHVLSSGHFPRIMKLGIHHPVSDPRAYYVPLAERARA